MIPKWGFMIYCNIFRRPIFFCTFYQQFMERTDNSLLLQYYVRGHFRYVDDLLIVFNEFSTNISELVHELNNISSKLKFAVELECSNKIKFLGDHLHGRSQFYVDFHISKISYNRLHDSPFCSHSFEHKEAGIRFFINRINTYTRYQR